MSKSVYSDLYESLKNDTDEDYDEFIDDITGYFDDLDIECTDMEAVKDVKKTKNNELKEMALGEVEEKNKKNKADQCNGANKYQDHPKVIKNELHEASVSSVRANNTPNASCTCVEQPPEPIIRDIEDESDNSIDSNTANQELNSPHGLISLPEPKYIYAKPPPSMFEQRKSIIYEIIASRIGHKWRLFGAGIEMLECFMNDLEEDYESIEARVYEMFKLLEENEFGRLDKVYYKIIRSLEENCNQRCLSNLVQEALTK